MTAAHGATKIRIASLAGLLFAAAFPLWGAPITFNTALPVHEGGLVWREQLIYDKNSRDPSPANRDVKVSGLVSVLGYGVTPVGMNAKAVLKFVRNTAIALALLIAGGWMAFVPSAQEPAYQFVTAWGEKGIGPGQFNDPIGIAVADGEVFVADSRNGRIQVFDFSGRFKRQFGAPGKEPGQLGRPMNLRIHGNEIYVAEYFNDRIQVFGLDGTPKRTIGKTGSGAGEFNAPGGVAVAPNGDLFIADFYNQRIQRLTAQGRFVRQWGTTGKIGIWAEEFNYPTDVVFRPDGTLYVADGYNDRIQAFGSGGAFLRKWGGPFAINIFGPFNGWFATVTNVTLDAKGHVFAADFYNHRIQKFAADGTFLTSSGAKGSGQGQFDHAIAVAVAADGTVFAVDFGNNRIEKWRQEAR